MRFLVGVCGSLKVIRRSYHLKKSTFQMDVAIQKSANDKCLYKAITLDNGLRALLISDQTACDDDAAFGDVKIGQESDGCCTSEDEAGDAMSEDGSEILQNAGDSKKYKMAAAALCIGVGSFSDPPELPGLAHFLEHMVFMGSEKYPEENAYDSFISKCGGSDNASTDCERTTFEMDVTPPHLKEALDIFAHCFISPLLKVESMEREIEAVDDEFELALPDDAEKQNMLFGALSKPGHPMSKFMYGNKKSLKEHPETMNIDLNTALKDFYHRYYSASLMTLAIQSTESLETLEEYVREIFPAIPNNGLPGPSFLSLQDPFKTTEFNKLYKIIPVNQTNKLCLTWVLPPLQKHYKSMPLLYLSTLIGDEGRGSILSHLRKKAWAVELEAGNDYDGFDFNSTCSLFSISITLTEQGMDHIPDILDVVFQYLAMLRREGPKEYIFKELQLIRDQLFRFKEQKDPVDYVSALAAKMQVFPVEHYLTGHVVLYEYDEQLISDCLNQMTIDEVNIFIASSTYNEHNGDDWKVEPWMQCKYSVHEIPEKWRNLWNEERIFSELHLPEPNKYIATDFELKDHGEKPSQIPIEVFRDELSCLWFKGDTKFKVPKGYAYFHILSPTWHSNAEHSAMSELFCSLLSFTLCDDTYPAAVAGVEYTLAYSFEGIVIKVYGFSHKLQLLLETVITGMKELEVTEETFQIVKKRVLEQFHNNCIQPQHLCKDVRMYVLQNIYWPTVARKKALENVTYQSLKDFVQECFAHAYLEGLIQGNFTEKEAISMMKSMIEKLGMERSCEDVVPKLRTLQLECGKTYCRIASFNKEDQNSFICSYYQLGPGSVATKSNMDLMVDFMEEPCFDELRTNKQLGYIVHCSAFVVWGVLGFYITVASPSNKFSCSSIDECIEEFLENFLNGLREVKIEEYTKQLMSLINCKLCEDMSLAEETERNWAELVTHRYAFDRKFKEVEYLKQLSIDDFKEWLEQAAGVMNERKKLGIQIVGPGERGENDIDIPNDSSDLMEDGGNPNSDAVDSLIIIPPIQTNSDAKYIKDIEEFKANHTFYPFVQIA